MHWPAISRIVVVLLAVALAAPLLQPGSLAAQVPPAPQVPGPQVPPAPGPGTLYIPLIVKRAGQVETGLQVQNLGSAAADLTLTYYDPDGRTRPEWVERATAPPSDSWTFYTPNAPGLPPGFVGSAVLQSTQPVGAIVNQQSQPDVRPFFFATFVAPRAADRVVFLPYAMKGAQGRNSTITVQNASSQPATVTASFYSIEGPAGGLQVFLPPFAARQLRLADRAELPGVMNASAVLQADQPIVAVGDVVDSSTGIFELYTGVPSGAASALAPLIFNDRNGWDSEIRIQNASNSQVTVRVRVQPTGGGTEITSQPQSVPPNAAYTFRPRDVGVIGSGFVGSAQVEASGNVVAVVSQMNNGMGTGMGYNAFGPNAGTPRISVPLIFKDRNGFDTGIQLQNVDNTDAQVRITYRLSTGQQLIDFGVVPANGSFTFYQPENTQIPAGSVGSAVVENIAGQQRLVAIVNEVNYARGGDASATYEGLNY